VIYNKLSIEDKMAPKKTSSVHPTAQSDQSESVNDEFTNEQIHVLHVPHKCTRITSETVSYSKLWQSVFIVCVTWFMLPRVDSFNVDTKNVKLFQLPAGIYFGYSLAMLRNQQGNW